MYLIPAYIFMGLFLLASSVHLYFCFTCKDKYRMMTKPLCMSMLGISVACFLPNYPLLYVGAFICCIGDIFLLKRTDIPFLIGTVFFLGGHSCFLAQMLLTFPYQIQSVFYIIFAVFYVLSIVCIYLIWKKRAGIKALVAGIYFSFAFVVVIVSGFYLGALAPTAHLASGILIFIGYLIFLFSDSLIFYITIIRMIKRNYFYTMSTYLVGLFCIFLGFILLFI